MKSNKSKRIPIAHVTLERAFSKLGICSRNQASEWILSGRVKVNSKTITDPEFPVKPEVAKLFLDGKLLESADTTAVDLWLFHKPVGLICSHSDEKGRKTIYDHLKDVHPEIVSAGLHSVGRLDQATSGLILLTHFPKFSDWLSDPKSNIERQYLAVVKGQVSHQFTQSLCSGALLEIEGKEHFSKAVYAKILSAQKNQSLVEIVLKEGKNREVRRLCEHFGHEVLELTRTKYGPLELTGLGVGQALRISQEVIRSHFPAFFCR